ncbi:BQ5605_C016g08107 [Microbotryum silenes-dioicae]|uniref:BQ5605_C016g08107 protein n=1 Tax=Microbotryum silenes-dioicae TaxID=796604 RepID=A0A2X0MH29_9BASI|nr:BQ5605_C016g08107 [Microbotryum silenes-dioicae]
MEFGLPPASGSTSTSAASVLPSPADEPLHSPLGSGSGSAAAISKSSKRSKTHMSCQECRRLKLKCDRVWPCNQCRKRGRADLCPHGVSKPPGRAIRLNAEMNALLKRCEDLEAALQDVGATDRIPSPLTLEFTGRSLNKNSNATEADGEGDDTMDDFGGSRASETHIEAAGVEAVLPGVGSLSIREDDGRVRYLGTSAGPAYYFEDDGGSSDESDSASSPERASQEVRAPFIQLHAYYSRTHELERLRAFLPAAAELKQLVKNYYEFLSFQFEPVEEEAFFNDYLPAALTTGNSAGTKLAFVFIVLSLGSLMDPRVPSTPNALAHHYFQLSQSALSASKFLSNNTLAGVQTLQLTASFLLNTHDLQEGGETFFPLLGMALRMLVAMGLHRDGSQWGMDGAELDKRRMTFYELITLERMQAFISGRPYMMSPNHFDTKFPSSAEPYHVDKWRTGNFIARVIDECFSVVSPAYSTVLALDQELRNMFEESPKDLRSGALPMDAFVVRPSDPPELPEPVASSAPLKTRMRQHTLDMIYSQIFFYLHLPALRQALKLFPDEPLLSPWAESVAVVALETGVYMLAIARAWVNLHPTLAPRWWHPTFHVSEITWERLDGDLALTASAEFSQAFAAACAQSSIVIQSPNSKLARHSWTQLMIAIDVFETAAGGGAPVAMFVPRLHALRDAAFESLQAAHSVPAGIPRTQVSDYLAKGKGTDAELSILGTTTRLNRKPKRRSGASAVETPSPTASQPNHPTHANQLPRVNATVLPPLSPRAMPQGDHVASAAKELYTPFDSPVLVPATQPTYLDETSYEAMFDASFRSPAPFSSSTAPPSSVSAAFASSPLAFTDHRLQQPQLNGSTSLPNTMHQAFDPSMFLTGAANDGVPSLATFTNFATGGFHPAAWASTMPFDPNLHVSSQQLKTGPNSEGMYSVSRGINSGGGGGGGGAGGPIWDWRG